MGSIGAMQQGSADRYFQEGDASTNPNADQARARGHRGPGAVQGLGGGASSSRWPAACARRCTTAAAPAIERDARARRVRRDHLRRHAREPRARRADHQGSAELPHGVSVRRDRSPRPSDDGRAAGRRPCRSSCVTVLIDMMSIGLIMPVLPRWSAASRARTAEQTFWYGVVTVRLRHRQLLRLAGARRAVRPLRPPAGAAARLLPAWRSASSSPRLATALWMLIAVRLFGGAMQANAAVANAYVADITPPEERARRFGLLGAMFGIGFILGPVMGGAARRHRPAPAVLRRRRAGAGELALRLLRAARVAAARSGAAPLRVARAPTRSTALRGLTRAEGRRAAGRA